MTTPIVTYSIIAVTTIVSLIGFSKPEILEKYLFSTKDVLQKKDYHRLFTSALLHVNFMHLFFNMFSYYSFGLSIENHFGPKLALVIYLYSALGGNVLALMLKKKNLDYKAVGASGAVCGIIFASIFLLPGGSVMMFFIPVPIPSWIYALFFMAISLYGIGKSNSMIGHEAHIGGAITGILWAVFYKPSIIETNTALLLGLTIPVLGLLIYFSKYK